MISHFIHLLLSMWFLLLVSTLHVATSDKPRSSFAVVKNNLLLTEYAWNLNTIRKSPIVLVESCRDTGAGTKNMWSYIFLVFQSSDFIGIGRKNCSLLSVFLPCRIYLMTNWGKHDPAKYKPCGTAWQPCRVRQGSARSIWQLLSCHP